MKTTTTTTKTVPAEEIKITCDKCGDPVEKKDQHDEFEFNLKYRSGFKKPTHGEGQEETLDLCQVCAEELVKLLKEAGYKFVAEKWNYII